jgi:hypothetical protein
LGHFSSCPHPQKIFSGENLIVGNLVPNAMEVLRLYLENVSESIWILLCYPLNGKGLLVSVYFTWINELNCEPTVSEMYGKKPQDGILIPIYNTNSP